MHRPTTLAEVSEVTEAFLIHYNDERPNQARSCGNQPPRVACPAFPTLPAVPQTVDPDRWLLAMDKHAFARMIRADGKLTMNRENHYVSRKLAGRRVTCWVKTAEKCFDIWQPAGPITSIPIKGLHGKIMPFQDDVALMKAEARARNTSTICASIPGSPRAGCGRKPTVVAVGRAMPLHHGLLARGDTSCWVLHRPEPNEAAGRRPGRDALALVLLAHC